MVVNVGDRGATVRIVIGRYRIGDIPPRMPAAQARRGEGVVGEQEVLDRMLLAPQTARPVRGGQRIGSLFVSASRGLCLWHRHQQRVTHRLHLPAGRVRRPAAALP